MYFTQLPDHSSPGFDEQLHFSRFKKQNIIFNARSTQAHCDEHVGCLSFKTVLRGEEWYGINGRQVAVRPGQFLILNDDQPYSCRIDKQETTNTFSVFFKKEFANAVGKDSTTPEAGLLDDPTINNNPPEFFQTLHPIGSQFQRQITNFITHLETGEYTNESIDEHLVFFLSHLIQTQRSEKTKTAKVNAQKESTRLEIFKRLCIAKDLLHSNYIDPLDLQSLSTASCLSIPQLIRQFRTVFSETPHRYLVKLRLQQAARLLKETTLPIHEITWNCGFENPSAFCRAFKTAYGAPPENFRRQ
jgi:AraC family transcriptional regulator